MCSFTFIIFQSWLYKELRRKRSLSKPKFSQQLPKSHPKNLTGSVLNGTSKPKLGYEIADLTDEKYFRNFLLKQQPTMSEDVEMIPLGNGNISNREIDDGVEFIQDEQGMNEFDYLDI